MGATAQRDAGGRVLHGPGRTALRLEPNGPLEPESGAYLGIIPSALLERAGELAPGGPPAWDAAAPLLEGVLAGRDWARAYAGDPRVAPWLEAARAAGVLSLVDAARAAQEAAAALFGGEPAAELWCVKEGHVASVWRARDGAGADICLTVARDELAARELAHCVAELRRAARSDAPHVAEISWCERTRAPEPRGALVAAGPWYAEARELHVLADDDGAGRFVLVEEFGAAAGGRLHAAVRPLERALSDELWRRVVAWVVRHSRYDARAGTVTGPGLDLLAGDVVWDGDDVRAVACTGAAPTALAAWAHELLDPGPRLPPARGAGPRWGRPELAEAALADALAARGGMPSLADCLAAAAGAEDAS